MGFADWLFKKQKDNNQFVQRFEMIEGQDGFYSWNGNLYKSDVVRSCIRPKAQGIGKLVAKHIRDNDREFTVNPDVNIRFLLEEPNPLMTGQVLQEKLAVQLALNNNAFAYIKRDEMGNPLEIYHLPCTTVDAVEGTGGDLFLKFYFANGRTQTIPYVDIIHLRRDFNNNDIFGDSPQETLTDLMEVISTIDQGIIKAIKNGNTIKWIMKFKTMLKPEDREREIRDFEKNNLSMDSDNGGAAATDSKYDLEQVEPKSYVPNADQMDRTVQRLYSFFNTNDKIVQSKFNEDEWNSYYEAEIEPFARQLAEELTRKLFSRNQRGFGNKIVFEANSLNYASMKTKLQLVQLVDRSMMNGNELRGFFNMSPVAHGNEFLRRLDTATVDKADEKQADKDTKTMSEETVADSPDSGLKGGETDGAGEGTTTD